MQIEPILLWIVGQFPWALAAFTFLGLLVAVVLAVIALTPTKRDDEELAKIKTIPLVGSLLAALVKFSPLKPRE